MTSSPTLAHTALGGLQGLQDGGVCAWLGVPYAQPPVGARRFLPPEPAQPWQGVRSATGFGAACPQKPIGGMKSLGPRLDEDCLTLNIWSPAADGKKRAVLVWIHGGAFLLGSARVYTGAHLAQQGDIVVVALNYRLGVFGFVNFGEALGDERITSNLGLRDQLAALQWVREHIAAFGGDPERVTIAGESAGSVSVSLLLHCEPARPLFHGAIMQSGALTLIHDREKSLSTAQAYVELLNVRSLHELQSLPVQALQQAQATVHQRQGGSVPAAPWFDGTLFPASLDEARQASTAPVPVLAGFNRDEIRFFEMWRGVLDQFVSRERMAELLRAQLGNAAAQRILAAYPATRAGERQLGTHMSFGMPTLHFAERHAQRSPTWFYRFDLGHPLMGAIHAIELFYLWDMPGMLPLMLRGGPLWGRRAALAQRLRSHWIHFVREGRPGDDWPAFDVERRATMVFDRHDAVRDDPERERRLAWAGLDGSPGRSARAPA